MKKVYCLILCLIASFFSLSGQSVDLEKCFREPERMARPTLYWYWLKGNISKEGITADLEAMKRMGLGGAVIFNVDGWSTPGPVLIMSEEWRGMVKHAISEGARLGLEIGMHNGPGWSASGGTWNPPEYGMQKVVTSETRVKGPVRFDGVLPEPESVLGRAYRDVAVVSFPVPAGEDLRMEDYGVKFRTSVSGSNYVDGEKIVLPVPSGKEEQSVVIEFERPFPAQLLSFEIGRGMRSGSARLEISNDGVNYGKLASFSLLPSAMLQEHPFKKTEARFYRITFSGIAPKPKEFSLSKLILSPRKGVEGLPKRSLLTRSSVSPMPKEFSRDEVVGTDKVINLSSRMDLSGRLVWDVPEGEWIILRVGHAPTGQVANQVPRNGPEPDAEVDHLAHELATRPKSMDNIWLECDKLNPAAIEHHWEKGMLGTVMRDAGPDLVKQALHLITVDSFEVGSQNWTSGFERIFSRERGYSMIPFLPVFSGRIVGSPEVTDRFLWDFRRTLADRFAEVYAGHFSKVAHSHGMRFALEPYGNGPMEDIQVGGYVDEPWAEFWTDKGIDPVVRIAASAGHVYGKRIVGAEAFTAGTKRPGNRWDLDPYGLKALGDAMFCSGVNRFVFHVYVHQPWVEGAPGITLGSVGTQFNRFVTWWEPGARWMDYIVRSQSLLQQGTPVRDILYFVGEAVPGPKYGGDLRWDLPYGYSVDACTADALLKRIEAKDGKLVTPEGVSYSMLVMKGTETMSLPLLKKLQEFVDAGVVIVGPKPTRTPGLRGYPGSESQLRKLVKDLWDSGKIRVSADIKSLLDEIKAAPNFDLLKGNRENIRFIHKRTDNADFYFVSNYEDKAVELDAWFRVEGKVPELWHPDTGKMEVAGVFQEERGGMRMPLKLERTGSVFVVFRDPLKGQEHVVESRVVEGNPEDLALTCPLKGKPQVRAFGNGMLELRMASGKKRQVKIKGLPTPVIIEGAWELSFPAGWGAPERIIMPRLISWTEHTDPGVKYFSGTATYRKTFTMPKDRFGKGAVMELDLGEVKNLVRVKINGRDLGVLWKPPFVMDVSKALKPGENTMELEVTNLWPNRLIGDEQLPDDYNWSGTTMRQWPDWRLGKAERTSGRHTFFSRKLWSKDDKLLPSGLMGSVRIRVGIEKAVE